MTLQHGHVGMKQHDMVDWKNSLIFFDASEGLLMACWHFVCVASVGVVALWYEVLEKPQGSVETYFLGKHTWGCRPKACL